jgi:hypothetical protein
MTPPVQNYLMDLMRCPQLHILTQFISCCHVCTHVRERWFGTDTNDTYFDWKTAS